MQSQRLSLLLWLKALTLTAFLVLSLFTGFYQSSLAARSAFVHPLGLRQNPGTFNVGPSSGHNIFVHDDVRRSGLESRTSPGLIASQLPPSTKISPGVLTTQQMRPPSFLPQSSASNFVSAATDGNGFGFNIVHPKPYQQQSLTQPHKAPQGIILIFHKPVCVTYSISWHTWRDDLQIRVVMTFLL